MKRTNELEWDEFLTPAPKRSKLVTSIAIYSSMSQLSQADQDVIATLTGFFSKRVNIRRKTSRRSGRVSSWTRGATKDGFLDSALKFCSWYDQQEGRQGLLEALQDLNVIHAYATYLHRERGNAATTISRDALRLGCTAWRYSCGLNDEPLDKCAPYSDLKTVMTEFEDTSSTTKKDWLQMRREGHFPTVPELKIAVFRIGKLMEAEEAKKRPDPKRLAKLAYKRFMLAMCALKPIARTKDLYLLQLPASEPERYPVCIVPAGDSGFTFHANMPKNKKRVQMQLSPEHCAVVADYHKYTPVLRRGKMNNFAFFDGSGSPVARLKVLGSTRSLAKDALDSQTTPADDASVNHKASAAVMNEKFHNVIQSFMPPGGQKATVTDLRNSWTTYYKNKEFASEVERAALEKSMQCIIGHCDATAIASYEKIDPQSIAALAVNVETEHYRAITGAPAPKHVPWAEVKEGSKVECKNRVLGRVVAKYSSKVAEVLPDTEDLTAAVQHVFVPYTDIVELAELPTYEQVAEDPLPTVPAVVVTYLKGLSSYNVAAVSEWLSRVGLSQYVSLFKEHHVDGSLLEMLEDSDLVELKIPLSITRKKILSEISKLKAAVA
jgi:hypothetical protein